MLVVLKVFKESGIPSIIVRVWLLVILLLLFVLAVVVDVGGFEGVLRVWYSEYPSTREVFVVLVVVVFLALVVDVGGFGGVFGVWYA